MPERSWAEYLIDWGCRSGQNLRSLPSVIQFLLSAVHPQAEIKKKDEHAELPPPYRKKGRWACGTGPRRLLGLPRFPEEGASTGKRCWPGCLRFRHANRQAVHPP